MTPHSRLSPAALLCTPGHGQVGETLPHTHTELPHSLIQLGHEFVAASHGPWTQADPINSGWIDRAIPVFPSWKVLSWHYATASRGHLIRTKDPLAIFMDTNTLCLLDESAKTGTKPRSDFHTVSRHVESEPETQSSARVRDFPSTHTALSTQNSSSRARKHHGYTRWKLLSGMQNNQRMEDLHPPNMHSFSMC